MRRVGIAMVLTAGVVAGQQGPRTAAQSTREFLGLGPVPDAAAAARGATIYAANCTFCHGPKATGGDTGPDLLRSTVILHDQKGETVAPVIRNGRSDRGMPAFPGLSDAQLYDLAEFLHMRVELTANRGTYQFLNAIHGDAKAGEAYFNGAGQCVGCHSVTGDLAHIGSKYSAVDLQQRFLYPEPRGQAKQPPNATITLSSAETISGKLRYLDDFVAVIAETANGRIRTITREAGVSVSVEDPLATHRRLLDRYKDSDMHNLTAYLSTVK